MSIEVAKNGMMTRWCWFPSDGWIAGNAGSFESIVMNHVSSGERRLIVDFSRLNFMSSSGMRVLLIAAKALKVGKGTLVLCSMKNHIEEVFRISGFDRIIPIKASRDSAFEASD